MKRTLKFIFSLILVLQLILVDMNIHNVKALSDESQAGAELDPNKEFFSVTEDGSIIPETVTETSNQDANDGAYRRTPRVNTFAVTPITSSSTAVVNFRTKSSSTTNTSYTEVTTGRAGYVNGYYAADAAFLGFDNDSNPTKVKFLQAGVIGWVSYSDVQVFLYTDSAVNTTSKYYVSGGRLYHGIVTNLNNSSYSSSIDCGPAPSYLTEGTTYFSYDGHYFYTYNKSNLNGSFATMLSDYRNNTRKNAINTSQPYYNYYLYLSHRSQTKYTASQLNSAIASFAAASEKSTGRTSKMRNKGQVFIDNQNKYGSNALLMIGVAANESAWGCSNIAYTKNNLFGHAAYDSDPNGSSTAYSSVDYSIYYHAARFVSKGYLDSITDGRYYGAFLGDKASGMCVKYASDPYWGEKAAATAWKIDKYLGGSDSYRYTIGIKDIIASGHSVIDVKNKASSSSTTLYSTYPNSAKTTFKAYAPSNFAFIILNTTPENGFYRIQSDSELTADRSKIIIQEAYSLSKSYAYIPSNAVTIVSKGTVSTPVQSPIVSVSLNATSKTVEIGDAFTLTATINPTNTTDSKTISWSSSDSNIAYVSSKGVVTAMQPGTATITAKTSNGKTAQCKVTVNTPKMTSGVPTVMYRGHRQTYGWQPLVKEGELAGTYNEAKRMEGYQVVLFNNGISGGIQYRSYVEGSGWESSWKTSGMLSGTESQSKRIEALQMKLTGEIANQYDIYYRVATQRYGWLGWTKNGEKAGTSGMDLRIEGMQVMLVKKGGTAPASTKEPFKQSLVNYQAHTQTYGWQKGLFYDGAIAGTVSQSKRMEAIKIYLNDQLYTGNIEYRTHVQKTGWEKTWKSNGAISGTTGQFLRIEAIQIRLTGEMAKHYDVYYRTHVQHYGWLGWTKNGNMAGTSGYAYRMEAIQIQLVPKGGKAPGSTSNAYKTTYK